MNQNDYESKEVALNVEDIKEIHESKSYVGSAWITFLFYIIGFHIVGFILNLIFLSKSKKIMDEIKRKPAGRGCLLYLLWSNFILIPILIFFVAIPIIGRITLSKRGPEDAKTGIEALLLDNKFHITKYETNEDYNIKEALLKAKVSKKIIDRIIDQWEFDVRGNPPKYYIAETTKKHPEGEGHKLWYSVEYGFYDGYGITESEKADALRQIVVGKWEVNLNNSSYWRGYSYEFSNIDSVTAISYNIKGKYENSGTYVFDDRRIIVHLNGGGSDVLKYEGGSLKRTNINNEVLSFEKVTEFHPPIIEKK